MTPDSRLLTDDPPGSRLTSDFFLRKFAVRKNYGKDKKGSCRSYCEEQEYIEVFGAREHNLKNLDIRIPKNKLVVFTGVSGSGKSSLAFDTIYNEGQRRYMESFSAYE